MRSQFISAVLLALICLTHAEIITRDLKTPRCRSGVVQVANKLYIAGGEISARIETDSVEILNLDTMEIEESDIRLSSPRQQLSAMAVGSDVYFVGGLQNDANLVFFDEATATFSRVKPAPWVRNVYQTLLTNNNRTLYVFGDVSLDVYHRDNDTWTTDEKYRALVTQYYMFGFAMLGNEVYIVGGIIRENQTKSSTVWTYNFLTGSLTSVEGMITPQYFPLPMGFSYSANGIVTTLGFNSTTYGFIVNVMNRQTGDWASFNLDILLPSFQAIPRSAVTSTHAFVAVIRSGSTSDAPIMRVNLATFESDLITFPLFDGTFNFLRTAVDKVVILGREVLTVNLHYYIMDQSGAILNHGDIGSNLYDPYDYSLPLGNDLYIINTANGRVLFFTYASNTVTSLALVSGPIADLRIYNGALEALVSAFNKNYWRLPPPPTASTQVNLYNDGSTDNMLLGFFGQFVVSQKQMGLPNDFVTSNTVPVQGGDAIPLPDTILKRARADGDGGFLVLKESFQLATVIDIYDTLNDNMTTVQLPALNTSFVTFAGSIDESIILVSNNNAFIFNTTDRTLSDRYLIGDSFPSNLVRSHVEAPRYNGKLLVGLGYSVLSVNTTAGTPLATRSAATVIVNHLLVYNDILFVADISSSQFFFHYLAQNRWDARLLPKKRVNYAVAAVNDMVLIMGGNDGVQLSSISNPSGTYPADLDSYLVFFLSNSSLSAFSTSHRRSEVMPFTNTNGAYFIGGKDTFGGYSSTIEIFSSQSVVAPVAAAPITTGTPEAVPPGLNDPPVGTIVGAVIGSVAGAVGIGLGVFFYLRHKKKKSKSQQMATIRASVILDDAITQHPMYTPFAEIKFGKMLGSGANGQVFLGRWKSTDVALKVSMSQANEGFIQEVNLMLGLRPHPNVVRIFGFSIHPETQNVILILEFCDGGSLDTLLFDDPNDIPLQRKLAWIQGIARGVLHLQSNNIVHRDLAARNVLLHRGEAKITDFGMSRVVDEGKKGTTTSDIGPIRWMAPESIANKEYSAKSDVWSFAVIMYEILSRQEPHVNGDPLEIAVKIRDEGDTPGIPEDCPQPLADIMRRCWTKAAEQRPTFQEITDYLDKVKL